MSATYDILVPDGTRHGKIAKCPGRPRRVYAVVESGSMLVMYDLGTGQVIAKGSNYAELHEAAAQTARSNRG